MDFALSKYYNLQYNHCCYGRITYLEFLQLNVLAIVMRYNGVNQEEFMLFLNCLMTLIYWRPEKYSLLRNKGLALLPKSFKYGDIGQNNWFTIRVY
jgi:hypothetical protein